MRSRHSALCKNSGHLRSACYIGAIGGLMAQGVVASSTIWAVVLILTAGYLLIRFRRELRSAAKPGDRMVGRFSTFDLLLLTTVLSGGLAIRALCAPL